MRTVLIVSAVVYVGGCYLMAYWVGRSEAATGKPLPRHIRGILVALWPLFILAMPGFMLWTLGASAKARAKAKADRKAASTPVAPRGRR